MARYEITLPSQELLEAFSKTVGSSIEMLTSNILESRTLSQIRDLLLPKLMSGEVRFKEAEKIMEAAA
jgi:type I restriction enzyme, S subunit